MWSRCVFWLRLGAAVFAGVAACIGVYEHFAPKPLPPEIWPWLWGIALVIVMFDNVGTLISRKIVSTRQARTRKLEKALMSVIINLSRRNGIPFDELGASVYVPERSRWRERFPGRFSGKQSAVRLVRVYRFRPAGYPQQSGVEWTSEKGKIGQAWTSGATKYQNLHALAEKYRDCELTEAQFLKLPKSTRAGFSCAEFVAIVGKYSEVLTEPIWHQSKERKLIGVMSIDRSFNGADDSFRSHLDKKTTREMVASAASIVSLILKPQPEET